MDLNIFTVNGQQIAEVIADEVVINDVRGALDLMANADYQEARRVILYARNLSPEFFDLRTGLVGEIVQKFANYRVKLAVVGEFAKFDSRSLHAFIVESNRGNLAFFVPDRETAIVRLTG